MSNSYSAFYKNFNFLIFLQFLLQKLLIISCGIKLTDFEQGKIVILYSFDISDSDIARQIKKSKKLYIIFY